MLAERPTQPADVLTLPSAAQYMHDVNRLQATAEAVAERHIRHCTPEFVEWMGEQLNGGKVEPLMVAAIVCCLPREAHMVQRAKGLADTILGDFTTWVCNLDEFDRWPLARKVWAEVRRSA